MGSIDSLPKDVSGAEEKELTVLVTGFGPFKDGYPINPSWEIASSLPKYLPWDRVKDPSHRTSSKMPRVRLLVYPQAVRVNYQTVREVVPPLWDNPDQKIDLALHIGMAGPTNRYSIERRGHRDGYRHKDVDGNFLEDEKRHEREGDEWIWHGTPSELLTDLDIGDIYQRWVRRSPERPYTDNFLPAQDNGGNGPELRISEDPGHYLCDFIYFTSLAHLYKQHRPRQVLFLHVPANGAPDFIKTGTELATQLLRSMVESEVEKKATDSTASN
ncbi:hypothetical protein SUNI508_07965 [Seiridium unicorne]|uniref:Pyroglutamyl peptidase type I n=1 Tax=Seiridium unicorne TaxID=138068 RepID=A0ABR2UUX6_9PEZI